MQIVSHVDVCWSQIIKPQSLEVWKFPFDKSISWLPPLVLSVSTTTQIVLHYPFLSYKCKGTTIVYLPDELSTDLTTLQEKYTEKKPHQQKTL